MKLTIHNSQIELDLRTLVVCALVFLFLFFLNATGAVANGVPVKIFLNYLPDVSTWGPQAATGEAVLAVGEGWATVSVQGLPKLEDDVYVAWVIPKEGAAVPIGKFNTDAAGTGDFEIRQLSIPEKPYRLFLITVEPDSDRYLAPGSRRSIAGRFPDPELRAPPPAPTTPSRGDGSDSGTASSLARPVASTPAPQMLPVTGGPVGPDMTQAGAFAFAVLSVLILMWFTISRRGGRS